MHPDLLAAIVWALLVSVAIRLGGYYLLRVLILRLRPRRHPSVWKSEEMLGPSAPHAHQFTGEHTHSVT